MPLIRGTVDNKRVLIDVGLQPALQHSSGVSPVTLSSAFNVEPLRGLIDTGAQVTCVTRSAAKRVGLVPRGKRRVGGVSSVEYHTAYSFVLGVWYETDNGDTNNATKGYYGFDPVWGCDFKDNSDFDVLIGMDIIAQGDLSISRLGEFRWQLS